MSQHDPTSAATSSGAEVADGPAHREPRVLRWFRGIAPTREAILATAFVAVLCQFAYLAAFAVRGELILKVSDSGTIKGTIGWVVAIQTLTFYFRGLCHRPWRAARFEDLNRLVRAATTALLILIAWNYFVALRLPGTPAIPRTVLVVDWVFAILAVGSMQAIARSVYEEVAPATASGSEVGVIIASAGPAGQRLARDLSRLSAGRFYVSGLLDDDHEMYGTRVGRGRVLGPLQVAVACAERLRVGELLVPDATLYGHQLRHLCEQCGAAGIRVRIAAIDTVVPAASAPTAPQGSPAKPREVLRVRRVELPDLLSRPVTRIQEHGDLIGPFLRGRRVLVTGAGGSIGSEICRQLIGHGPRTLVLVERSEAALFEIHGQLAQRAADTAVVPLLVDITSSVRMEAVLRDYRPEIVIHAAAYKHLPLMEAHPIEAIENNALGTACLADACVAAGVETFVALSTDKAVYPSSVMGASKLVAERFLQALGPASGRRFVVVRFGNVIGSSGSAVPIFTERLRRRLPVTVTHPDVRRYFMTIEEAARLVILAAATGDSGGLFVLDMGESVPIVELVHAVAFVMGIPRDDVRIEFSELRAGEKLDEELFFADETRTPTTDDRVTCAKRPERSLAEVRDWLDELREAVRRGPADARATLMRIAATDCGASDRAIDLGSGPSVTVAAPCRDARVATTSEPPAPQPARGGA